MSDYSKHTSGASKRITRLDIMKNIENRHSRLFLYYKGGPNEHGTVVKIYN